MKEIIKYIPIGIAVLISGCSSSGDGSSVSIAVAVGVPDTAFDSTGTVIYDSGLNDSALGVTIDGNGKVLTTGYISATTRDMAIWRYNDDGTPDTSFNSTGLVSYDGGSTDTGYALAIDDSGKILVTGRKDDSSTGTDMAIWRYNSDGTPDTSLNGTGFVTFDGAADFDYGLSVAIDADGKIVIAGRSYNGTLHEMALWRYNSDGTPDTTFNGTGFQNYSAFTSGYNGGKSVVIDGNGKIVVAGYGNDGTSYVLHLWRYNSDGSLDTSFNSTGIVTYDATSDDGAHSVTIDSNGKILVVGYTEPTTNNHDAILLRYNSDGTLDTSFNTTGVVTYSNASDNEDFIYTAVIDNKSNIVTAGYSQNSSNIYELIILRYDHNGALDTTFNNTGIVTYSATGDAGARDMIIDSQSRLVLSGDSNNGVDGDMNIWRYK